ncbi:hypothetical protein BDV3_004459 [Batrachochytrium dendrobatidis]
MTNTVQDLDAITADIIALTPKDDAAREALSTQAGVFRFLKDSLETLTAADLNLPDSSKHLQLAITLAKLIAEVAKYEPARQSFAEMKSIPMLVNLHSQSTKHLLSSTAAHPMDELTVQTLRALANLCFDHESNRDIIGELKGAASSVVLPLSSVNSLVIQTACGALVNISMDNEFIQTEMVNADAISLLLKLLDKVDVTPCADEALENAFPSAIRALSNLVEPEIGIAQLIQKNGLVMILGLIKKMHEIVLRPTVSSDEYDRAMNMLDGLAIVLETIGEKESVQREIFVKNQLVILLDFVDHQPTCKHATQTKDDENSDISYFHIRKAMARVVITVTMNDENMKELVQQDSIIARFHSWMTCGLNSSTHKVEEDIRMSGALSIGNLARSDATCLKLVEHHRAGSALIALLKLEVDHLRTVGGAYEEAKSSIKVLHAVIGALKNLSLAAAVRPVLGSIGTIERIVSLFEFEHLKPVHYSCIGVLKNLTAGMNDSNVYRLLTGLVPAENTTLANLTAPSSNPISPLGRFVSLIWKATADNDTGIRNEGGRVITNLVRAIHRTKATQFLNILFDFNCIIPLVQIVTGATLTKPNQASPTGDTEFVEDHHVRFDALPIEGQVFPMIQNEGIVALTLICSMHPASTSKIIRFNASLIPTLFQILKSGLAAYTPTDSEVKLSQPLSMDRSTSTSPRSSVLTEPTVYSLQTKTNVCLLLRTLMATEPDFVTRIAPHLKPLIQVLMDNENAEKSIDVLASEAAALSPKHTGDDMIVDDAHVQVKEMLTRTSTFSAKGLTMGVPTRQKLLEQYSGSLDLNDPVFPFKEVLKQLMDILP